MTLVNLMGKMESPHRDPVIHGDKIFPLPKTIRPQIVPKTQAHITTIYDKKKKIEKTTYTDPKLHELVLNHWKNLPKDLSREEEFIHLAQILGRPWLMEKLIGTRLTNFKRDEFGYLNREDLLEYYEPLIYDISCPHIDILVPKCSGCGTFMNYGIVGNRWFMEEKYKIERRPSLERKDSSGRYTVENTEIICELCNMIEERGAEYYIKREIWLHEQKHSGLFA